MKSILCSDFRATWADKICISSLLCYILIRKLLFKFVFMDLEFSSVRSTYKRTTVHPPFRLSSFCLQGNKLEWSFVLADVSFVTRFPSNRRFFRQNGWKWSLLRTFMYAVAIVNVLMANSSDVNLAKTRYVRFAWLWNLRLVLIEWTNSTAITRIDNFFTCCPLRNHVTLRLSHQSFRAYKDGGYCE